MLAIAAGQPVRVPKCGESLLGRGAIRSFPNIAERCPGTTEPRGTEFICVNKHPSPFKAKAPAQPPRQLECCSVGLGVFVPFFLPLVSYRLLQLGL